MEQNQFISFIKDGAIRAQQKFGICASLTMAQAILESGWGKYAPGNNLFGIKWTSGCGYGSQTLSTKEYEGGRWITVNAQFRVYSSLADSVYDHAVFIVNNSRYHNLLGVRDYRTACRLIKADGYATDPNYTNQLIEIIEQYHLNQYDGGQVISSAINTAAVNNTVKIIQTQLNTLLKKGLAVDGVPGPNTIQTVRDFQSIVGLTADGVWGAKTAAAVGEIYSRPTDGVPYPHREYATRYIQMRVGATADGSFGNGTKIAVQNWQARHGLGADGVVGTATWNKFLDENV